MSWLIPGDNNDPRRRLNLRAEWTIYSLWVIPIVVAALIAFATPLIYWLREILN